MKNFLTTFIKINIIGVAVSLFLASLLMLGDGMYKLVVLGISNIPQLASYAEQISAGAIGWLIMATVFTLAHIKTP